jgi:hypothetical protein
MTTGNGGIKNIEADVKVTTTEGHRGNTTINSTDAGLIRSGLSAYISSPAGTTMEKVGHQVHTQLSCAVTFKPLVLASTTSLQERNLTMRSKSV